MAENEKEPFNPNSHLMQIKNRGGASDYLPVQWRLVWFRELCPNGTIETEVVHLDLDRETEEEAYAWNNETRRSEKVVKRAPGFAVFRAVVKDGRGGVATGTKSEKAASFADFIEKAETGSIGRALAALGYGTQFTGDEFDERHRIVDAPVDRPETGTAENTATPARSTSSQRQPAPAPRPVQPANAEKEPIDEAPATEAQITSMRKLYEHLGMPMPKRSLTYSQARTAIKKLADAWKEKQGKAQESHVSVDEMSAELAGKQTA